VNDDSLSIEEMRLATNSDVEDLQDMLDNLRMEFKYSEGMCTNEVAREVKSGDFLRGFKRSMQQLAKNGKNILTIKSHEDFPTKIKVQQLNVKRIINNLLSNALKHTK